jgi:hypothetical protein
MRVLSQTLCFSLSGTGMIVSVAEDAVFKGRPFDRSVILLCVHCYLAHGAGT